MRFTARRTGGWIGALAVAALAGCSSSASDPGPCAAFSAAVVNFHSDCGACAARNERHAADGHFGSYAKITFPGGASGGAQLRVQRTDGVYPGGSFGAIVSASGDLDLRRDVVIRSFRGVAQGATSFGTALPLAEDGRPQYLRVVTQAAYDAIEVVVKRSPERKAAELRVHEFCGV